MIAATADTVISVLLTSLRIGPTLAFAPPFTLLRTPASVRLLLGLFLSVWIVAGSQSANAISPVSHDALIAAAGAELLLGVTFALALQLAFAAITTMGGAVDFQVGFGLSALADPTLRTQMPLVGAILSYAAGAIFFATDGPHDLLAIWARSVEVIPLGGYGPPEDLSSLLSYLGTVFFLAAGLVSLVMLTLFLADIAIAFLSRTLPQMNVLVLGFQAKTLCLLVSLPLAVSVSGSLLLRIMRLAIENTPRLA